ncbi:hypothetical protein [Streptomyces clavifer]|uniref:hypothetical protein n=1 Tax=Streptomyces clavifer TaxID=68188 RepID=UPI002E814810|nr:hypothetical protein [Streptomyces clavifer]WRY80002.1 hypothetical protein OG388_01550 [Streptomyces clavifer]WRY86316.1 hypothetical protein OG388_36445 [Streptomyces clavifer]WUC32373.1 hypothetical protein OG927_33890 [Streptomyces clavifer]
MSAVAEIERWLRRWHLIGAGVDNVWYYTREVLPCPSGRWLARGPNGTGKTTLLEGLCPFLLNPVHMHLSSASGRATSLVSLMKGGSTGKRRFGCLWLSFGTPEDPASGDADAGEQHYGLRMEYAASSNSVETVPFRLPVVPGHDGQDLSTMKRDDFCAWVAAQGGAVFASADTYVADLAQRVFGCGPGTLKRIARRIKKVRNPGLSPADATAELRMALPTVSQDTVRSAQEALAAAEATRRRYERDAKTAQVLEDLSAAWSGPTGLVVRGIFNFETLQVYAATTLPGFCRLTAPEESTLVEQQDAAAILTNGSLAYLTYRKVKDAPEPADRITEFFIHAYGPEAEEVAERFAQCVRVWDREVRESGYPPMTVHPAATPDNQLPPGDVLDKPSARLVFQWPGRIPIDALSSPGRAPSAPARPRSRYDRLRGPRLRPTVDHRHLRHCGPHPRGRRLRPSQRHNYAQSGPLGELGLLGRSPRP